MTTRERLAQRRKSQISKMSQEAATQALDFFNNSLSAATDNANNRLEHLAVFANHEDEADSE